MRNVPAEPMEILGRNSALYVILLVQHARIQEPVHVQPVMLDIFCSLIQ
jgi:hypothetical protein